MVQSAVILEMDLLTFCPLCVWMTLFSNTLDLKRCVILTL